jgi:hypothetical protein
LLRLPARAENEIDNHIKILLPEFGLMVLKELPIPKNFFGAVRHAGFAAMENRDLMAALLKLLSRELPDEAAAADEKDFHVALFWG